MDAECGSVAVKDFIQGPGTEGQAGTSPPPPDGPVTTVSETPSSGLWEDSHQRDDLGGCSELQVHEGKVFGQERLLVKVQHPDICLDGLPNLHLHRGEQRLRCGL